MDLPRFFATNGKFHFIIFSENLENANKHGRWKGNEYYEFKPLHNGRKLDGMKLYLVDHCRDPSFNSILHNVAYDEVQVLCYANDEIDAKRVALQCADKKFNIESFEDKRIFVTPFSLARTFWIMDGTRRSYKIEALESLIPDIKQALKNAKINDKSKLEKLLKESILELEYLKQNK